MTFDVLKIILPSILAFLTGIAITPFITDFLYKNKMWKKKAKTVAVDGHGTPIFNKLHKDKEINTPRLGGVIIWISAFVATSLIWILGFFFEGSVYEKLDFVSRNQTWIPFAVLIIGALTGLIDDLLEIAGSVDHKAGGLSLFKRLAVITLIGLFVSSWFYFKLDVTEINLPFLGTVFFGWTIIPIFTAIILATYSTGVIDGIDGLSGGVFSIIFGAYSVIAFSNGQVDLAAFCALITGSILAFLWFNIPPARFYMSETGSMALTATLATVAFMTDTLGDGVGIAVLPIIALPLVITTGSVIIQVLSKKFRNGKKVFLVAPIHHHFEAVGWPAYKVTMRYWIFSVISAIFGIIIALSI